MVTLGQDCNIANLKYNNTDVAAYTTLLTVFTYVHLVCESTSKCYVRSIYALGAC